MAFQFLCPQGHLLEGDESQVGQQCKCPSCGAEFLVPQPTQPQKEPVEQLDGEPVQEQKGEGEVEPEDFPGIQIGVDTGGARLADVAAQLGMPGAQKRQDVFHILCPSGHQLETPREMLGSDAMCPFCGAQFRLRLEDSLEYKQQMEAKQSVISDPSSVVSCQTEN